MMWGFMYRFTSSLMLISLMLMSFIALAKSAALIMQPSDNHLDNSTVNNEINNDSRGCLNCFTMANDRQLAERLKLEAIKKQILSKLNLPEKPNITAHLPKELILEALRKAHLNSNGNSFQHLYSPNPSHPSPHQYNTMHHLDNQNDEDEDASEDRSSFISNASDDYYGKTSEIVAFAEPGIKVNGHTMLVFIPTHDNLNRLEVTSATLWIYIRLRQLSRNLHHLLRDHYITLYVFRVKDYNKNNNTNNEDIDMEMIASHKIRLNRSGWKHIDIRDAVHVWFSTAMSSTSKLTLLVDCVGCDSIFDFALFEGNTLQPTDEHSTNININSKTNIRHHSNRVKNGYRPFMVIATETKKSRRSRRHTLTCDTKTNQCCKQSLYVSFKELGWDDWIIAPKGYFANYCVGDCSKRRTPDTYVHFHSHVIEEYRNKNPYASITPCCAPTKLSSISLIYFDPDTNIIKADLPKMVVEECGCT